MFKFNFSQIDSTQISFLFFFGKSTCDEETKEKKVSKANEKKISLQFTNDCRSKWINAEKKKRISSLFLCVRVGFFFRFVSSYWFQPFNYSRILALRQGEQQQEKKIETSWVSFISFPWLVFFSSYSALEAGYSVTARRFNQIAFHLTVWTIEHCMTLFSFFTCSE